MTGHRQFRSAATTHVGLVRQINEDRLLDYPDAGIWAVADGMGGHRGGGSAAATAIRELETLAAAPARLTRERVRDALDRANSAIRQATGDGEISGCTIAGVFAGEGKAHIFWAGDSRVYRWRGGRLDCMTHDHSLVQEWVDAGALTADQARGHPRSNVITRALGTADQVEIDFRSEDWCTGDRFLVCSDGVWGMIEEPAIAETLSLPLESVAPALCGAALDGGGRDNLALIVIDRA
ncbi:PP2C family protein-serine/threonine phosphatase [Stakelama marina]|uniref:Serine/threonine-protein phosphatase n=1 Tax=Stakelama marina TaxID=2826939 RepID=A0A8T4IFJ4_9SPHN|nr:protein phosphatase 2C domain-containing protein [Stakelama marina]MBR0553320.1 serine/threonine-protein phosphatase [Stakelama marina]